MTLTTKIYCSRQYIFFMLKELNPHQNNFKIIEDVENIDHLNRYI
jgi:hypothetical protein